MYWEHFACFPDLSNWRVTGTSSHQFAWQPTPLRKAKIQDNHNSILCSFGILTRNEEQEFPSFYCIHSSYKCPCKRLYICKCSNKPLLYHLRSNNGLQNFTVILATPGLCESDVDSALFYSCVRVRTTKIPSTQVISLKPLTYLPFTYLFPTQN